jgi:hypothetical protein
MAINYIDEAIFCSVHAADEDHEPKHWNITQQYFGVNKDTMQFWYKSQDQIDATVSIYFRNIPFLTEVKPEKLTFTSNVIY